jgi:multiple sugar transport system substrate-binding protein
MLFYNRAALKKAGVEPPSTDPNKRLTWAQLLALAKKVQDAGGAKWGLMFQQVDRYYQLQPLFESSGAGSGLTGGDLLTPAIDTDKWIQTAKWYADTFESGLSPRGIDASQTDTMFGSGDIAFFVGGSWAIPRWLKSGLKDFGVAPMPYFAGGKPVTPTGAWSWAVNPHSAHKDMANKFLQFATLTAKGSALTVENFPLPPANPGGFEIFSKKFIDNAPEGLKQQYEQIMNITSYELKNTAIVRPRTVGYVAFETVINQAFSDIRNGGDVGETLSAAQKQLSSSFRRLK